MKKVYHQKSPFIVPTDDGKLIAEHFGRASSQQAALSVARMVAPPGWKEPFQTPEFEEYTLMVSGKKCIEIEGEEMIELLPGESIRIASGVRVRYSNHFSEPAEYWSLCLPAFSPETVNREE